MVFSVGIKLTFSKSPSNFTLTQGQRPQELLTSFTLKFTYKTCFLHRLEKQLMQKRLFFPMESQIR